MELSEEYDILKLRILAENKLIQKISEFSGNQMKLYGKAIENQLDTITYSLILSYKYRLKKLRNECISQLAKHFSVQMMEKNAFYQKIEHNDKLEIMSKKLSLFEEKIAIKDKKIKQLEDENLKQKFEINRLKSLNQ